MDKLLVKMPRSEGDVLVRMKSLYEEVTNVVSGFKYVRMPKGEADLLKRKGLPYDVVEEVSTDDVVTAFVMAVIDASKLPEGSYLPDEAVVNQSGVTLAKKDAQTYTITADFEALDEYVLNYEDYAKEGAQKWLVLGFSTGEQSIVGMKCNGVELTDSDIANAALFGLTAGGFVCFVPLKDGDTTEFVIENEGKATVVSLMMMNSGD